jgi:hypothetical protein
MMTIVGRRKANRDEAIVLVDNFITSFTKSDSDRLERTGKLGFDDVSQMAWSLGLGGWYYDDECSQFCTDKIMEHVYLTHFGYMVVEDVSWVDGQN